MQITLRGKYRSNGRPARLRRGGQHITDNRNNQPNRKKNGPKTYEYGTIVLRVDALTGASRWEA